MVGKAAFAGFALLCACSGRSDDVPADPTLPVLDRLRTFETSRRAATDFRTQGATDDALGADPIGIARMPDGKRAVGVLRGAAAVVLLDADGHEVDRAAAPRSASSVTAGPDGEVFVSGDLAGEIARYRIRGDRLERTGSLPLDGVRAVRAIMYGPEGVLHAVEEWDHRLLTIALGDGAVLDASEPAIGLGPVALVRTPRWLVVQCVLSHEVVAVPVDARGRPRRAEAVRVQHNGPMWSVDAAEVGEQLWLAIGGVEDHPLDRRQGSFGYIDSFAFVYRIGGTPAIAERLATVNVGALDVVTPKLVRLRIEGPSVAVQVTGYATPTAIELEWQDPRLNRKGRWPSPGVRARELVPGISAEATLDGSHRLLADPLLDAWVVDDGHEPRVVPVPGSPTRDADTRLGEALFFTTLMAPWNRTKGSVSRFTCETCHFEGYVDGRIHDTGREDVKVTTRPLRGLFNDLPYFSRALDPDLTAMVHNEFRVAGRRSRHDPWFSIEPARVPWLVYLDVGSAPLTPEALRRSLMTFFMRFSHRPNPSVLGRTTWSPAERQGAEIFRDRCEGCHEARLVANQPASRVPFAEWEALVMSPTGPILWARDTRERTGVVPYVHPEGARVSSLRRLYKKRPYLTNGSAADLDEVLLRAGVADGEFTHAKPDREAPPLLDAASRTALRAFLDLL